jgi:hypothetical protein
VHKETAALVAKAAAVAKERKPRIVPAENHWGLVELRVVKHVGLV